MTDRAQQELPGGVIRHESGLIADMEDAARKWATERGLVIKADVFCRSCDPGRKLAYESGGAVLKTHTGALELCWSCLPVPGTPLANWEYWYGGGTGERCIRCEKPLARGGCHSRSGSFCWDCDRVPEDEERAYLLRLRDEPDAKPPWAGDRVDKKG